MNEAYQAGKDESTPWSEKERWRPLWIQLGHIYANLAWLRIHRADERNWYVNGKLAAGLLIRSVDAYQNAGMGRKAEAVSRYARLLRRAYWRRVDQ